MRMTKCPVLLCAGIAIICKSLVSTSAWAQESASSITVREYVQNLDKAITINSNYLNTLHNYDQSVIELEYLIGK